MKVFACLLLLFVFACNEPITEEVVVSEEDYSVMEAKEKFAPLITEIESAHEKTRFLDKDAIQFDLKLTFGGKQRLDASIIVSSDSRNARIERADGERIIVNDERVFCTEGLRENGSVRFTAYTWTYFFLLPYKLSDEGTKWQDKKSLDLNEKSYRAGKLSFGEGVGDAPDDWYLLYADPDTRLLEHAAYIVTAGVSTEEAERDPHSIEYMNYELVNGIPFATQWRFWEWREDKGLTRQLGEAQLSNIRFLGSEGDLFKATDNMFESVR